VDLDARAAKAAQLLDDGAMVRQLEPRIGEPEVEE